MVGSFALLMGMIGLFMLANLAVGFTFSTLTRNQLQALQATFFFFLPSMLLSGFMFPFRGMPVWAQRMGEVLPLTHFLRIVRGILLKGNGLAQLWPDVWPLLAFLGAACAQARQAPPPPFWRGRPCGPAGAPRHTPWPGAGSQAGCRPGWC